ncbi:MAG: L,D-transpeptidase [Coxiellaceae bacterium]|nr:L,D-transpeptidase [Coxiellaceae bacterium]
MRLIVGFISLFSVCFISSGFASSAAQNNNLNLSVELSDSDLAQVAYGYSSNYFKYDSQKYREGGGTVFPRKIRPQPEKTFFFSPRYQAWAAYDRDGQRIGYGRANGGSDWCAELGRPCRTPRGEFRIRSKGSADCKSSKYPLPKGGAPMPFCMHFKGGYAVHGSPGISNTNSSHGCIRVYNQAAYWLSNYFLNVGTKVVVLPY